MITRLSSFQWFYDVCLLSVGQRLQQEKLLAAVLQREFLELQAPQANSNRLLYCEQGEQFVGQQVLLVELEPLMESRWQLEQELA